MRIAVVSPHCDDALFSVGEHMLSRPDAEFHLVIPCGAIPAFEPDTMKYATLLNEHDQVTGRTGWVSHLGPFVDDGVVERHGEDGKPTTAFQAVLVGWLAGVLQVPGAAPLEFVDQFDEWWIPHGIHHPDHLNVRDALVLIRRSSATLVVYEELPYRVIYPLVSVQMRRYALRGLGPLGSQYEAKRRLCNLYASQMGETEERCLYAPERLWGPE